MPKTVFAIALAASRSCQTRRRRRHYALRAAARAAYIWQGPYVGANLGYQWGWRSATTPAKPSGVVGGVQAGYNWQIGQFVFGGETDLQVSDADDTFAPWKFSNPWFGTLRARAGFAMSNVLFYGTVGLAYGTLNMQSTLTDVSEVAHQRRLGRRRRRRSRADGELDRQSGIPLRRSERQFLCSRRRQPRHPVESAALRRELSLLTAA